MKVTLYNTITMNGMIAGEDDDAGFVSEAGVKDFERMIRKAGNMIVGRKTYEVMQKDGDIRYFIDVPMIIVSRRKQVRLASKAHVIVNSPRAAIDTLKKKHVKDVLIAGGSRLAASFIAQDLVDEICIYIEPTIFEPGIPFFRGARFTKKLILVEMQKASRGGLRLRYRVAR